MTSARESLCGKFVYFLKPHWDTFKQVGAGQSVDSINCSIECKPRPMFVFSEYKDRYDVHRYFVLTVTSKSKDGNIPVGTPLSDTPSYVRLDEILLLGEELIWKRKESHKTCDELTALSLIKIASSMLLNKARSSNQPTAPHSNQPAGFGSGVTSFVPLQQRKPTKHSLKSTRGGRKFQE